MDRVNIETNRFHDELEAQEIMWDQTEDRREEVIAEKTEKFIRKEMSVLLEDGDFDSILADMITSHHDDLSWQDAAHQFCKAAYERAEKIVRDDVEANWKPEEWM